MKQPRFYLRDLFWLMLVLAMGGVMTFRWFVSESVTLRSLSPDDQWTVHLIERPSFLDRNFKLVLKGDSQEGAATIFRSPDEGRPIGSERIVWSPDSTQFALLGRHFYTDGKGQLANGETLYLLYDLPSGKSWCNSPQQTEYPNFTLRDAPWIAPFVGESIPEETDSDDTRK